MFVQYTKSNMPCNAIKLCIIIKLSCSSLYEVKSNDMELGYVSSLNKNIFQARIINSVDT